MPAAPAVMPTQYVLLRMLAGVALAASVLAAGKDLPFAATAAGVLLGALIAAGWRRRAAAVFGLGLWLWQLVRFGNVPAPGVLAAGLGCALLLAAPAGEPLRLGSRAPGAAWHFPPPLFRGLQLGLILAYAALGGQGLAASGAVPAALGLAAVALLAWPRTHFPAWAGLLVLQGALALTAAARPGAAGFLLLHLLTIDARWLPPRRDERRPVLLYDGECGLCNGVVRLLLRDDAAGRLAFAPLQSEPAQAYLRAQGLPARDFDSLVFVPDWNRPEPGAYRLRTDGALGAVDEIGGLWRIVAALRVLPAGLRDAAYALVARSRYALFGAYRPAPLPDPAWERRFLAR